MTILSDIIIFKPDDVDLKKSPLRKTIQEKTFVLGSFNPGLCRLPNGNLLMMVRIAEALQEPVKGTVVRSIRWDVSKGFILDEWPREDVDMSDPRKFRIRQYEFPVYALTSLSWLLPVELNADGSGVLKIHYDRIIIPERSNQEYGIEDPRITILDGKYYMTTCCVSSERHSTILYKSEDGLNYSYQGMILDHQNKDMLFFQGKINNQYYALTRPLGECYFASPPDSAWHPGASIQLASSPDLVHWKPADQPLLRARRMSKSNVKIGGGTPPVLTGKGWLIFYHGVEQHGAVGIYRTFWALLDKEDPNRIIYLDDTVPVLEAKNSLTESIQHQYYLTDVVFTTGIVEHGNNFILASGELDLACRITTISRDSFLKDI
jgi:beta-1,2-mannobiose phosphorylase / 1,2-beta-oligomannan phosphorylase